jgi:hypothetical protein
MELLSLFDYPVDGGAAVSIPRAVSVRDQAVSHLARLRHGRCRSCSGRGYQSRRVYLAEGSEIVRHRCCDCGGNGILALRLCPFSPDAFVPRSVPLEQSMVSSILSDGIESDLIFDDDWLDSAAERICNL